ncbi:MAG: PAS domain S-box protein [Candidatus Marinimicrobia bacterium]|nr:PAS domain S-box protein [Candidatus Neomarinimicrobiota bacterium]
MSSTDLKPNSKFRIGVILIVTIVLFLGGIAIQQMNKLSQLTDDMYNHPLSVSKALLEIEANVIARQRSIEDAALSETPEALETALLMVAFHEQQIQKYYSVLYEKYLGERQQIDFAYNLSLESNSIRDEVIALLKAGSRQEAMEIMATKGAPHIKRIFEALDPMLEFAEHKAIELLNESQARQKTSMGWLIFTLLLIAGSAYFVLSSTIRNYKSSEQKYTNLIHNMREGVTIGSAEGVLLYVNPSYATMLGYSHPDELIGNPAIDVYAHPDERDAILEKIMIEGFIDNMELDLIKKDGSLIHVMVSVIAKRNRSGDLKEIESTVSDLSGNERYEAILKQSEHKFRSVTESTVDAIISISKAGNVISWNRAAEAMFQYNKLEILSKSVKLILPHKSRVTVGGETCELRLRDISTLIGKVLELEGLRKDGSSVSIELTLSSWSLEDEQYFTAIIRDITSRNQVREELLESEARLRMVIQQSPSVIEVYNLEGLQVGVNKAYEELWGFPEETTVNKFNILKSKEVEDTGLLKYINQAYAGHAVMVPEYQFDPTGATEAKGLGRVRWLKTQIYPLKDGAGKVKNIVISHEDTTDRKVFEENLKISEERFNLAMDATSDGLYDWNLVDNTIYYSPQWKRMLGYEEDELPNDFSIWEQLTEPEDVKKSWEMQQQLISGKIDHFSLEFRMKHKQGHWVDILSRAKAFFDDSGQANRIIGTHMDISANKYAENQLSKSEQLNRAITDTAADAIISIGKNGLVTTWNYGAEKMFGFTAVEMMGSNLEKIVPSEHISGHSTGINRLALGGKEKIIGKQIEMEAIRKDGSRFPVELGLSSWQVGGERNFTAIIRDITERKAADLKIGEALEEAKHANMVKDQFIANISHEIRTPLNSIIGFSDLFFQRYGDQVAPRDKEIFGFITKASNRLMSTVDSILNISLLKAGNLTLQPRDIDLNLLVSKIIAELRGGAEDKGLTLNALMGDTTAMIHADEYCTYQSIFNLTENAIKFTYEGLVQLEVTQINGNITLLISDTGIGMSEEYQSIIFTPYSQESEGFTKTYQGIGLGLALAKQYLDLNQIALKLVSKLGVGTTFTLAFPTKQVAG